MAATFAPFAHEDFLVTLANKGLYKRALKDIEMIEQIHISRSDEGVQVTLGDATVTLYPNISSSLCSCPSKTVCKHIIMGILAVAASGRKDTGNVLPDPVSDVSGRADGMSQTVLNAPESGNVPDEISGAWKSIKEVDISLLRKLSGKKLFEDTLRLIQDGWTADFKEGEMLEATINTENITVYFPRQNSIEHAICKCGATGLCKHKLIAILSYLNLKELLSASGDGDPIISLINNDTYALLESTDAFIVGLLEKGIISCGENESETAIQYSIRLETSGIGNLARMLRSLSSDLDNMLMKHVSFNALATFATLSRLHNTIRLILSNRNDTRLLPQLIENTRSDYYTTPVGTFTGLGASPWQTRSGYFGITAYVFHHEKQNICTYTVSMADYYTHTEALATMSNLTRQYLKSDNWSGGVSLAGLSQSNFTLRNFKLNKQLRLSSSNQTQCELTGKVNLEGIERLKSFPKLFDITPGKDNGYQYFGKRETEDITLIPFNSVVDAGFSKTKQKLTFTMVEEGGGEPVEGSLEFNDFNREAIRIIEKMSRHPDGKLRYMICSKRRDTFIPISMIGEKGIENFFFNQ